MPRLMGVCVARGATDLERCQAVVFWRGRFYDGLRLVDANGDEHEVVRFAVTKPVSALGQKIARFLDLGIGVEIETRRIGPASLADVVKAVDAAIEEDAETFEEFSGRSVSWWRSTLGRCSTARQVVRALAEEQSDS